MKINPGIHHQVEARVRLFVRAVATGAAIGVMMAAFYTFNSLQEIEDCNNGIDDDADGWVDLADSDCACPESTEASFYQLGAASYQGSQGCTEIYQLTANAHSQSGAMVLDDKIDLGAPIDVTFALEFGRFDRGGLGISVALFSGELDSARYGVRAGEPFIRLDTSLIVELNTDHDATGEDSKGDQLSIFLNGNLSEPVLGPILLETDVEDDQEHYFRLTWNPKAQQVDIYFDDMLSVLGSYQSNLLEELFHGDSSIHLAAMAFTGLSNKINRQQVELLNLSYRSAPSIEAKGEWADFSLVQYQYASLLNWQTPSEYQSSYFEIERSEDGKLFSPLARLDAAGYSPAPSRYHFKDENLPFGESSRVFYRIKRMDLDGEVSISQVLELPIEKPVEDVSIEARPNPATNRLNLAMSALGPGELKVMNTNGDVLETKQLELTPAYSLQLDVSTWSQGLYIFQLRASEKTASTGVWVR
ncbi:MAG: T9SS type A sorting domain-containing protein [Bacteroidota bacterium]